jgi:Mrp family chromosome partitioning ATPase
VKSFSAANLAWSEAVSQDNVGLSGVDEESRKLKAVLEAVNDAVTQTGKNLT